MNVIEKRIEELAEAIQHHSELYYNKSEPEITDSEFDILRDELVELVELVELNNPTSLSLPIGKEVLNNVGSSPSYGKKVKHSSMMGSLEKVTTFNEVREWYYKYAPQGCKIAVEPKYDGCAGRINFTRGKMLQAATRGDGTIGQDVTDNVKAIKRVPKEISPLNGVEIRGEVMMFRSDFAMLVGMGEKMKNPRNAGTGSLMAQDPKVTESRSLSFVAYDVITDVEFETESEKKLWMSQNLKGFNIADIKVMTIDEFENYAKEFEHNRSSLNYETDGLVISLDNIQAQEDAGWNGKRPRGKVAFKFKPTQTEARVIGIDHQVGRTGKLTPMARIEPTYLDGSTIRNITLHNDSRLNELGLNVGDDVIIAKAGDIIPEIVDIARKNTKESFPTATVCPSCHTAVTWDERGVALWCVNSLCPAHIERTILHWVKTLDIKGLGKGIVGGLCEKGFVSEFADLYFLTEDQIQEVTGGANSAQKIVISILEKGEIPLDVFLDALGMDGLGTTTSKIVANEFKTLQAIRDETLMNWLNRKLLGEATSIKIYNELYKNRGVIDRLLEAVNVLDVEDNNGPLSGMSFVLTGSMSKPRKQIAQDIESAGGEVKSSISKGVTYLVQADSSSTSSKTVKAGKVGTSVISEDTLWTMIDND